jgi:hypothetical protein
MGQQGVALNSPLRGLRVNASVHWKRKEGEK